ncbi:MAG TPA: hypothetical protein PLP95_11625 [Microthrixaceae bacterium]|nr:hypothetical protein [Microthrixaceae bacterium]
MRVSLIAWIVGAAIAFAVAAFVFDTGWLNAIVAIAAAAAILKVGLMIIGSLATPIPEPPDEGELRKVKITYRCEICGAQVRMTFAASQTPEPPRHCMEEMEQIETPDI